MDQHNSVSAMGVPAEEEDDNAASVDSEQLMADIDEFIAISESPETEEVVELYDYEDESESNTSGCAVKNMSADEPTSSSGSVVKSFDLDYQEIQLNQPVVLISKLDQFEIAKYSTSEQNNREHEIAKQSTSKQNISEGVNSESDCKKSEKSSEMKKSVWSDDMDGSLSELSVSDFSLSGSDIEDENVATIAKSNLADGKSDSKAENINKSDVIRVDQRRNSKENFAASHATNSKSVQSKSKSSMPTSQSRASGTSSLNTSKNIVKFKGKPENSAKSMTKSLPCETSSKGMTKCSAKETSFKSTTKSFPREEIISKHDNTHLQGKQVVKQKENIKKDLEYFKHTECGSSDECKQNWRYELILTNFNVQELTNESFRKFINLASDCAMYFSPPTASNKATEGGVSLYFGDFAAIQSALQKLGQVLFTSTSSLQGQIIGRKMLPLRTVASGPKASSGGKWKIVNHVKMYFTLHTSWAEKLKQLVQVKDWKKADERHEKFAKIQRVPTSVTKQFLSLLFPFSINIYSPNSQNASKKTSAESFYPIDVKYASQELMETVLACYQNLSITIPSSLLPLTKLYVSNVKPKAVPPGHKGIHSGATKPFHHEYTKHGRLFPCKNYPPHRQQLKQHDQSQHYHQQHRIVTDQSSPGANKAFVNPHSTTQHKSDSSMSSSTPEQTRDKKRSSSTMENTRLLGLKSRFNLTEEKSASQSAATPGDNQSESTVNTSCDMIDVKKMAEAQGLDPNNSDVLCILEMQKQLVSMQSLISLPQSEQQQPTAERDPKRSTEEIEIAEAEQKLRESIATGQKQLFDLEEKLKTSKRKIQQSKHDSSVFEAQDYNKPSASVAPPPNLNDQPLDFKKPQPRVELAVKADEMRSKITAVVKEPLATFKKPLPITLRKAPIKAEDCALPLEFGKNVLKVNPKDIGQQSSEGQERGKERSKFGRGGSQLQGMGINTDNKFRNRDGIQKRRKTSRWSSVDDRDVSLKDRRGSEVSLQHGIDVTNQQRKIGMKVLGDGLLPTPTESLETTWGRNDAQKPDSKSKERRKFSEQGPPKTGRNFMSRNRDTQVREEDHANIHQSQNQRNSGCFDDERGDGYQNKRSVGMQDPLPNKRSLSQISRAGNKGLSIIEKLQQEAFARGKEDNDLSGAPEQFRRGSEQFYQYGEETDWTVHGESQHGWENQNKAKIDSVGSLQSHCQRDRDYSGVKGQRKPLSSRLGSESQSVSHLNDDYYGGSAALMFKSNSTDTGVRINRGRGNREDEHYMEYDRGYEDEGQSSGGVDRLGEMDFSGNRRRQDPVFAKRPKLDHYQSTREAAVSSAMNEWNQQVYDGDWRGGPYNFGRDKGGSKGFSVMHKAGRESGSDLCDREKEQNNYYPQRDEYNEGNDWEHGHWGAARGIEMAEANKEGNIATRALGFEKHPGGISDIRVRERGGEGVKRGGFGAAGRGGFQGKGSVGIGFGTSDSFSGGVHRTGAGRGRGGHFGKVDYEGILHEDSGHYNDDKQWSFDNGQGDGVEFDGSRDEYSHGDYGRPSNVNAGIGNKQSFFENMKGDNSREHVGKSFGFNNKGDGGNFGRSDRDHGEKSFGSSDKGGGGGNFGSSKRGRGGRNFGNTNTDISYASGAYGRSDKGRGGYFGSSGKVHDGDSYGGNDKGRADDRYGSNDRGRDGSINRGGGDCNSGSSDRNHGGSDGSFSSRDSGASSFGRIDSNNGRGHSTEFLKRKSLVQPSHGGLGLLGAVPTSGYGEIGDEVRGDFAPLMNRGVNFY